MSAVEIATICGIISAIGVMIAIYRGIVKSAEKSATTMQQVVSGLQSLSTDYQKTKAEVDLHLSIEGAKNHVNPEAEAAKALAVEKWRDRIETKVDDMMKELFRLTPRG